MEPRQEYPGTEHSQQWFSILVIFLSFLPSPKGGRCLLVSFLELFDHLTTVVILGQIDELLHAIELVQIQIMAAHKCLAPNFAGAGQVVVPFKELMPGIPLSRLESLAELLNLCCFLIFGSLRARARVSV